MKRQRVIKQYCHGPCIRSVSWPKGVPCEIAEVVVGFSIQGVLALFIELVPPAAAKRSSVPQPASSGENGLFMKNTFKLLAASQSHSSLSGFPALSYLSTNNYR